MNIRKPSDYSSLYSALDVLMGSDLAEMELYCEIGRAVWAQQSWPLNTSSRDTRSERAFHPVIYAVCGCFI